MEGTATYESVRLVKSEVFVYKIPPMNTNLGHRANEWKLDKPDWTGRMRMVALGARLSIKLEDKTSGELFAQAIVDEYPGGVDVVEVKDSSRYFVIRIRESESSERKAFIGIGFQDRGDAFDFRVGIQDHFKWLKQEKEAAEATNNFDSGPKLDLSFKEGQTIKLNLSTKKMTGEERSTKPRPKPSFPSGGGIGILPPPPGGVRIGAPPRHTTAPSHVPTNVNTSTGSSTNQSSSLLGGPIAEPPPARHSPAPTQPNPNSNMDLLFGLDLSGSNTGSAPLQPMGANNLNSKSGKCRPKPGASSNEAPPDRSWSNNKWLSTSDDQTDGDWVQF